MPAESATSRLERLLTMVPWLLRNPGVQLSDAAQRFGVTEAQFRKDLDLVFVCGTPGHMPDDLIEVQIDAEGRVTLSNADTIARPLRFGLDEALTLLVGLRVLAALPELEEREAVDSALRKLTAAVGDLAGASDHVVVSTRADERVVELLPVLRDAVEQHRRVRLDHVTAARDERVVRDVDPMRVVRIDDAWYFEGWCHRADAVRLFKVDRIESAQLLEVDGTPPAHAQARDLDDALFQPAPDAAVVELDLAPEAAWIAEHYPIDEVESLPEGRLRVRLRTGDLRWVEQVVLRTAGGAQVRYPERLRDRVAEAARTALAHYDAE